MSDLTGGEPCGPPARRMQLYPQAMDSLEEKDSGESSRQSTGRSNGSRNGSWVSMGAWRISCVSHMLWILRGRKMILRGTFRVSKQVVGLAGPGEEQGWYVASYLVCFMRN